MISNGSTEMLPADAVDNDPQVSIADTYFFDRAEAELERALAADHPSAARAHYLLVGLYLDRFYGGSAADAGSIVAEPALQAPRRIG
jgi:hypothetical protein